MAYHPWVTMTLTFVLVFRNRIHVRSISLILFEGGIPRTSDNGNGNHSVWLPIILIKIKVDQMLPLSYISMILHLIS